MVVPSKMNLYQRADCVPCVPFVFQIKDSVVKELQQKSEETELLQMELQMLETERVRLSLVEEKLVDILQLLQQLRDLVSHRSNTTWLNKSI